MPVINEDFKLTGQLTISLNGEVVKRFQTSSWTQVKNGLSRV